MIRLVAPLVTVVVLLSAVLAVPASAQGVREGKMRIVGRATVEAVPDYVTVQVGISNRAASPTAALDQNSAVARKIIDFSKGFGVAERDIQTSSVNLAPNYKTVRDPNGTTRQEPDGWREQHGRVKLGDLAGGVHAKSRSGATYRRLHFGVTDLNIPRGRTRRSGMPVRQAKAGAGCRGQARIDPGVAYPSAQPVQPDGWRGYCLRAAKIDVPRSRNHQDDASQITWAIR
jgi:hypothetical protein